MFKIIIYPHLIMKAYYLRGIQLLLELSLQLVNLLFSTLGKGNFKQLSDWPTDGL